MLPEPRLGAFVKSFVLSAISLSAAVLLSVPPSCLGQRKPCAFLHHCACERVLQLNKLVGAEIKLASWMSKAFSTYKKKNNETLADALELIWRQKKALKVAPV